MNKYPHFKVNSLSENTLAFRNQMVLSKTYENLGSLAKIAYTNQSNENVMVFYPVTFKELDTSIVQMSQILC